MAWYKARKGILLLGILGLALALRLVAAARFVTFDNDTIFYMKFARYFLATGNLTEYTYFGGIIAYVPVFPSLLALIYFLFKENVLMVASLTNIAFGTLTCLVVYFLANRIMNRRAGLLAALIAAVTPWLILWSGFVLMEPIYTLLISLAALLILMRWSLLAGMVLGLTVLTRTYFLGFLPFLLAATVVGNPNTTGRFKRVAFIMVGLVSVLTLWSSYVISTQEFRFAEFPHLVKTVMGKGAASILGLEEGPERYRENARAAVPYQQAVKRFWLSEGGQVNLLLRTVTKKLSYIWALSPPELKRPWLKRAVALFYGGLFGLALAALVICRAEWRILIFPLSYLVGFSVLYIPLYAAPFFKDRAPLEPFVILLSTMGLTRIFNRYVLARQESFPQIGGRIG